MEQNNSETGVDCRENGGGYYFQVGPAANAIAAGPGGAAVAVVGAGVACAGGSGTAGLSSYPAEVTKGGKYYGHSQQQMDAMEGYFKAHPHPNESESNEIAKTLGLDPIQVRIWFQNMRNRMKIQTQRKEKEALQHEMRVLLAQLEQREQALKNNTGQDFCVGSSQLSVEESNMKTENIRPEEEPIDLSSMTNKFSGGAGRKR